LGSSNLPDESWFLGEYRKNPELWDFRNDFYDALASDNSGLSEAYRALREQKADFVTLTGSGSAFVGVFRSYDAAKRAAEMLNGWEGRLGKWS